MCGFKNGAALVNIVATSSSSAVDSLMKKETPKTNLLTELAKQKSEAQKTGANKEQFGKFKSKAVGSDRSLLGPSWGGRNGQGKP